MKSQTSRDTIKLFAIKRGEAVRRAERGGLSGTSAGLSGGRRQPKAASRHHQESEGEGEKKEKSSTMSPPGGQHIILTALRGRSRLAARRGAFTYPTRTEEHACQGTHGVNTHTHTPPHSIHLLQGCQFDNLIRLIID